MSYQRMSRRRGNGYGVLIEGHAADAHYDRLGQDEFDAEYIRADNLRTMDEDMIASEQTLTQRVPLDIMEQDIATMEQQISADAERTKAELDAQRIVDDDGQLLFPVDPGQNALEVSDDIPSLPPPVDDDALVANQLKMQAESLRLQTHDVAPEVVPVSTVSPRVPPQRVVSPVPPPALPAMPQKPPFEPQPPPPRSSVTTPVSYENPYPEMPPEPPLRKVSLPEPPKKSSIVPIIGIGLLALFLLRK